MSKIRDENLLIFSGLSGAKECKSCSSRKMLKNVPTLAIRGVDTAENEPIEVGTKISEVSRMGQSRKNPRNVEDLFFAKSAFHLGL